MNLDDIAEFNPAINISLKVKKKNTKAKKQLRAAKLN